MYQKILIIVAVLVSSIALGMPTSAKEVRNGVDYWTVSEMREFMLETEAEFSTLCGNDGNCKRDLLYERAETDHKYRALENFEMEKLILSSVNPSNNTIKVYYQDEDKMHSYMFGHQKTSSIEDFYMLWVEEWLGNPFKNGSWLTYGERYPYFLGDAATVESASHLMIDEDKERNGSEWFTPNIEREYLVKNSNLNDNTARMFYYSLLESNGGRTNGIKDYRSCFKDTDYEPGMECRYLFGSDGVSRYFPFNPESTATPTANTTEPSPEVTNDAVETNSDTKVDSPTNSSKEKITVKDSPTTNKKATDQATASVLSVVSKPVIVDSNKTPKTNQISPKTAEPATSNSSQSAAISSSQPSTTQDTPTADNAGNDAISSAPAIELPKSGGCEKETIFPWWFIILVTICDAIIMWFFWPKKSEKGVDKRVN
ncbi:hypothetical protein IKF20_03020 [Candidatus Saccharibacteria bacterium]|nr:hypothetical protein [Candidatus Saccharibacteria bacterium]